MKKITVRRYYLSDFMYDNYKDDPTNIYDGFFVDLMPNENDNFTDFWLGYDGYAVRDYMFGIHNEDCDTDKKARDFIERNEYQYIEDFVNKYFDDECCCDECEHECECEYDDPVYEAIDIHNEAVDKLQELGDALLEQYPDVEETPANDAFCEVYKCLTGMAIYLCCEANAIDGGKWMTTEDWHVIREEDSKDD